MKKVVVGVSGGSDSIALLHTLITQAIEVIAVHVNYQQRDSAQRDQELVESFCAALGVKLFVFDYDIDIKGNFQKEARDFRYARMVEVAYQYHADAVAVGHHFDDHLETYLLNKLSGRHSRKVGLAEYGTVFGYCVWRPMLQLRKTDILEYCQTFNLEFNDDESNQSLKYKRNEIRHKLLAMDDAQIDVILCEMKAKQRDLDAYYGMVDTYLEDIHDQFSLSQYLGIPDTLRLDVLRQWIWNQGVGAFHISDVTLKDFDAKIVKGKINEKIGTKVLCLSYENLCIFEPISYMYEFESLQAFKSRFFELGFKGETIEGITLTETDFPIVVRSPKHGDRIQLRFGQKSIYRFFIDRKISHNLRHSWPIVENAAKDVVFVSRLGCDIRHFSNNPNIFVLKL